MPQTKQSISFFTDCTLAQFKKWAMSYGSCLTFTHDGALMDKLF